MATRNGDPISFESCAEVATLHKFIQYTHHQAAVDQHSSSLLYYQILAN